MPNRPAKNISSLASHTITPTLTMFGRFSVWILALIAEGPGGAGRSRHRWIMDCRRPIMRLRAALGRVACRGRVASPQVSGM